MKQPGKGRLIIDGVEIISTTCSWSDLKDKTIYLAGGGHQITIEFTDAGYMDKLRLAYSGPDTLRKPTMFPFESRDDILYMGQPPVLAKEKSTKAPPTSPTSPTTTTTTKYINHQVIDVQVRDQEIEKQKQIDLEEERRMIRERIYEEQQAHFHKG